jgi:microcystin-dependent protein
LLQHMENHLVPPGGIIMWSGAINDIPVGWALCDGSNGTPDLRDRFIVGAGGSYDVGNTGGASSVTLDISQIPSHSHSGSASSAGSHTHDTSPYVNYSSYRYFLGSNSTSTALFNLATSGAREGYGYYEPDSLMGDLRIDMESSGSHSHSVSIESAGGGQSHENRPPYYALAYIMKL